MKSSALSPIIAAVVAFLKEKGVSEPIVMFDRPGLKGRGDIATGIALRYAKETGKKPLELAEEIAAHLSGATIASIKSATAAAPGFINVHLSDAFYGDVLKEVLAKQETFGKNQTHKNEKWVIEHTSPNPNKAMHLGHLHNNLVGMSLANIIEWGGAHVVRDAIDNNRGIAIAKLMYGFLALMKKDAGTPTDIAFWSEHRDAWFTPEEKNVTPDRFVTECYVFGSEAAKNPEADKQIRGMVVMWEAEDKLTWKLWEHVLGYSYQGMQRTLMRLGNKWDVIWHEHEIYKEGKRWVEEGLTKGVFKKLDDGAVLTDLSTYNLPDTIVLKADGTALYITQDIALTAQKKNTYHADKLVWVVGPEQTLQLKQVFAVCEQLGIGKLSDFIHVPFGYVGLADEDGSFKKMSSREGTVVLIDDVIDVVKEKVSEKLETKNAEKAEKLAVGAVKFTILKANKDQQITFSVERSIDVHGDSGVYVMYTYARIRSLMRKAQERGIKATVGTCENGMSVMKELYWFPNAIVRAGEDYSAHHIAQYLLELCGAFNAWYAQEIIVDGGESEAHKVAVAQAASIVIKSGLSLLGIETLEEI